MTPFSRGIAAATSAFLALGLSLVAIAPASTATAAIGATVPAASPLVPAPVVAPALLPMKNYNCGWGMTTKTHSCVTARALAWYYKDLGYPSYISDVYSANSGNYYDFSCRGGNSVTCRSYKGKVYLKRSRIPSARYCGTDSYGNAVQAWLYARCPFALETAERYLYSDDGYLEDVYEPANGRYYDMVCFSNSPTICYNNKDYVIIRN